MSREVVAEKAVATKLKKTTSNLRGTINVASKNRVLGPRMNAHRTGLQHLASRGVKHDLNNLLYTGRNSEGRASVGGDRRTLAEFAWGYVRSISLVTICKKSTWGRNVRPRRLIFSRSGRPQPERTKPLARWQLRRRSSQLRQRAPVVRP